MPRVLVALLALAWWCPSPLLADSQEDWILLLAQCEARVCAEQQCEPIYVEEEECASNTTSICNCTRGEVPKNATAPTVFVSIPELHCHDEKVISVHWNVSEEDSSMDLLFVVESRTPEEEEWAPLNIVRGRIAALYELTAGKWKVRVRPVSSGGQRGPAVESDWLETAAPEELEAPESVRVDSISYGWGNASASISWIPGSDKACTFRVYWFSTKDWHNGEKQITVYEDPYQYTLPNLLFSDNYTVFVFSVIRKSTLSEKKAELEGGLQTESCLDVHQYNLTICPPDEVQDLEVTQRLHEHALGGIKINGSLQVTVELHLNWTRPAVDPDYYVILVEDLYSYEDLFTNVTIPGYATQAVMNVTVAHVFIIRIWSVSAGGEGPRLDRVMYLDPIIEGPSRDHWHWAIVAVVVILFLVITFTVLTWWSLRRWHSKKLAHERSMKIFEDSERGYKVQDLIPARSSPVLVPEPEVPEGTLIPREQLILGDMLGAGCFGTVSKGLLTGLDKSPLEVAVKRLRADATPEEERQFSFEIDLMKSVGQHPNIVSMLGCTVEGRQRLLIVEYCALGDLQRFLREAWKARNGCSDYERLPQNMTAVFNASYGLDLQAAEVRWRKNKLNLTAADLLSMARQVAIGMEYLAHTRVVHRDLAARNILVCGDRTVKISDFGLSRDVYEQNIYHQSSSARVPVKWMAIEALQHREYTTQSDVWSFGILLYEIVTFGACPYPSISNNDLFHLLLHGYRMGKPASCNQELYEIMMTCWRHKPSERPTFSELKDTLDKMLQTSSSADYIQL